MIKVIIILDKYSDWLESFSVLNNISNSDVTVYYISNDRNDKYSITSVFEFLTSIKNNNVTFKRFKEKNSMFDDVKTCSTFLRSGDYIIAPFIRYRDLWKLIPSFVSNVKTIHLSECLPDTFGHVGYRLGFRGNKLKTWLTLPLAKVYAMFHKPDLCYFPLYPTLSNPFVKQTYPVEIPPLLKSKSEKLLELTQGEKRVLLIGGFGYDVKRMAEVLKLDKYIATSKGIEIIIDGKMYPLSERICAEEVLLSGYVSSIVGYTSSAMVWAKIIDQDIKIDCYEASAFNRQYGFFFNSYAKRALEKIGIEVKAERKEMLVCL